MRGRSGLFFGLLLGLLTVFLGVQQSFGAGFALYEGSARGNALGGAVVGRADDPSALFFNPAGITQLPGLQAMGGATFIIPSTDVITTSGGVSTKSETETNVWVPPHLYITYQFSDSLWFGFGTFGQFGLGTEFEEDWPGRYNNYNAVIKTLTANPNVAWKITDRVSVAAGMNIMWFDLELENKIDPLGLNNPITDVDQSLTGDSFGYGFNLALHYRALDWLSLGISYRSQIKQKLEGEADFTKSPLVDFFLPTFFPDTDVSGSIVLPDEVFLGVMVKPIECLSVEVSAIWTRWSTFDELKITYDDVIAVVPGVGPITQVVREKDWSDVWRIGLGVEYQALDWLDLRFGYTYDQSPIDDEHADYLVPANDRHLFSFGPGFHWRNWTADLSYTYLLVTDRDDIAARPAEGILDSEFENGDAHLIGLSLSYKF